VAFPIVIEPFCLREAAGTNPEPKAKDLSSIEVIQEK
jgi:hypothetical protein